MILIFALAASVVHAPQDRSEFVARQRACCSGMGVLRNGSIRADDQQSSTKTRIGDDKPGIIDECDAEADNFATALTNDGSRSNDAIVTNAVDEKSTKYDGYRVRIAFGNDE